jgi:uncharacterized membrane protein
VGFGAGGEMGYLRVFACSIVLALLTLQIARAQTDISNQLTFTTIDVPGAGATIIYGINAAGDVAGVYGDDSNSLKHAFVARGGVFTLFDYPGADSTLATGINDSGLIVGYANFGVSALSFLYDGTTFSTFRDGNRMDTFAYGINNAGWIVGTAGFPSSTRAFERRGSHFQNIKFPGLYYYGYATGINSFGQVAGYTDEGHGYEYSQGKFTQIDFPGAILTQARGINDGGLVVGWYGVNGPADYGFVFMNGQFTTFRYPGAQTFATGINMSGQVVGDYTFDFIFYHGFVTSPVNSKN